MANSNATKPYESKPYDSVSDKARGVGQASSDLACAVGHKAADAASAVGQKAADAASTVGQKAESATAAVGGGMKSLAGTIRDKTPAAGVIGGVTGAVADTLESGGRYLEEKQLSGMAKDATDLIRRNPLPAVLLGIGFGFMLARLTMSSRS